jgi:hypothetical protein
MRAGRIVVIIIAALIAVPSLAMLIGGGALAVGYATERDDDGYFDKTLERLSTPTAAIAAGDADLRADPGPPEWLLDLGDFSVRLQLNSVDPGADLFLGIGPSRDVDVYLGGVAHDEIRRVDPDGDVRYRSRTGAVNAPAPTDQMFWVASVSGPGRQDLTWEVQEGEWKAVLMNADGSAGLLAEVTVGIKSGSLLGIAVTMLIVGFLLTTLAIVVIVIATRGRGAPAAEAEAPVAPPPPPAVAEPAPEPAPPGEVEYPAYPVRLEATLDEPLSQWKWLVKWILAIPHFVVLAFLWAAFVVVTVIAWFGILFTGTYPRGMFDFNVGVLRWTWRVMYYAISGGLGTDRYPPFALDHVEDYPARLEIEYTERLSRGLALVKWWLLAIPHYLVLAFFAGSGFWFVREGGGGLVGLLVLIAAVTLLFTARYPRPLFDLIIGLNRWGFRVIGYAALMTDDYPPFRLDQGGKERPRSEIG